MWDGAPGLRKRRQIGRMRLQSRVPRDMTAGDTAIAPESGQRSGMGKPSSRAEGQAGTLGHSAPFQPGRKGG